MTPNLVYNQVKAQAELELGLKDGEYPSHILRLSLNMRFDEIDDPKELCRDVSNVGRWGNGDVEVGFSSLEQLDDVMALIRQAFDKHSEESEA